MIFQFSVVHSTAILLNCIICEANILIHTTHVPTHFLLVIFKCLGHSSQMDWQIRRLWKLRQMHVFTRKRLEKKNRVTLTKILKVNRSNGEVAMKYVWFLTWVNTPDEMTFVGTRGQQVESLAQILSATSHLKLTTPLSPWAFKRPFPAGCSRVLKHPGS